MHLQTTKSIKVANPIFLQFTMQGFVWNKFLFATKFILKARTKLIKPVNFFNVKCIWFSIWTSLIICLNFRLRIYIGSLDKYLTLPFRSTCLPNIDWMPKTLMIFYKKCRMTSYRRQHFRLIKGMIYVYIKKTFIFICKFMTQIYQRTSI